jgi:hypothetical protein
MLFTNSCGCEFEVDAGVSCCGSCHCQCYSWDALDNIYSIVATKVCEAHRA